MSPRSATAAQSKARRPDRAATEAALMEAAVRLLERDGVLAGLSLQEVADEAGVNRGLIHHYFGSRQLLLRAALDARRDRASNAVARQMKSEQDERGAWTFRTYLKDPSFARVIMLLALDGDEEFEPIPYLEERLERMSEEHDEGIWNDDADDEVLIALWDTFLYGYFVLRESMARQLGLSTKALDRRMFATFGRAFEPFQGEHAEGVVGD